MAAKKQAFSVEKAFEQIEAQIERLNDTDTTLEESFQIYQEGMSLLKTCNEAIDRVEKKVLQLNEESGLVEFEEEDFDDAEAEDEA